MHTVSPLQGWLIRFGVFGLPLLAGAWLLRGHHGVDRMLLQGRALEDIHMERLWEYSPAQLDRAFRRARRLDASDRGILRAAAIYRLNPRLLHAVAIRESRMNAGARGAAGEIGMFQIMPNTAKHWAEVTGQPEPSEAELFDVILNAEIAAWYLRRGLDAFAHREDPLPFALAYYNAGPGRVRTWEKNTPEGADFIPRIPFASTRDYVRSITEAVRESAR